MRLKKEIIRFLTKILNLGYVLVGVPVIITNKKGEILMGKRDKNLLFYPSTWGLPGGVAGYKESIEDTAKRELEEEMGIGIKIIKYGKPLMRFPRKEFAWQILDIPLHCKIIKGTPQAKDETLEINWFKPEEIKK